MSRKQIGGPGAQLASTVAAGRSCMTVPNGAETHLARARFRWVAGSRSRTSGPSAVACGGGPWGGGTAPTPHAEAVGPVVRLTWVPEHDRGAVEASDRRAVGGEAGAFPELATVMRRRGKTNGFAGVARVGSPAICDGDASACGRLPTGAGQSRAQAVVVAPGPGSRSAQHQRGRERRAKAHRRSKVGIVLIGPCAQRLNEERDRGVGAQEARSGYGAAPSPCATAPPRLRVSANCVGGGGGCSRVKRHTAGLPCWGCHRVF